jgi:serine/threonine protein kinase
MAYNQDAPVFAERYRFEPVDKDWDVGRSGYTHLVFDLKEKRYGVIKRAEVDSKQSADLRNEISALKALKGLGVPDVYETGQAVYGSKNYEYVVIEFIDGIRVEKNTTALSKVERVEILTQFFNLLAQAHNRGIVNGDVDLKHLFWRREKGKLIVIDWGNAKLNIDTDKKAEFAYDLARSAEIIFSLVTDKGHPPSTGPLSLPGDSMIIPGLRPMPIEYDELCQWAPRKPISGIKAPVTALELLEATQKWSNGLSSKKDKTVPSQDTKFHNRTWVFLLFFILFAVLGYSQRENIIKLISNSATTATLIQTPLEKTPFLDKTPSPTDLLPTASQTQTVTVTPTETTIPTITPSPTPRTYLAEQALVFDNKTKMPSSQYCWQTKTELDLTVNEGFFQRTEDNYWGFRVLEDEKTIKEERPIETPIYVNFIPCLANQQITGFGLNAYILKIVPERIHPAYAPSIVDPGREFGLFLTSENNIQREYTLWIDKDKLLHLKIRENGKTIYDNNELVVSTIQTDGAFPRVYNKFPIQIFLELNNNGMDVLYLLQGTDKAATTDSLIPTKMILKSTLPTVGSVQKIGLVGYGGETQVLIWPLAFYTAQ